MIMKENKISIGATIIILIVVALVSIGVTYVVIKNEKDSSNSNVQLDNVSTEDKVKEDTNVSKESDSSDKNTKEEKENKVEKDTDNTNVDEKKENTSNKINTTLNEQTKNEIVGRWNTFQAIDPETGKTIENLREIFGLSYATYGSYLEFKEDGTFKDAIDPVGNGEYAIDGTYEIQNSYYKLGDCWIFLTYSDGTKRTIQRIYYSDDNVPVLSLQILTDDGVTPAIQYDMKK